jgi:hypothetical protein
MTERIEKALAASGLTAEYIQEMSCAYVSRDEIADTCGRSRDDVDPEGGFRIPYPGVTGHDGSPYYRYRQFSREPKYLGPKGHDHQIYVPIHFDPNCNPLERFILEGEKKTACLDCAGLPALGIPGVTSWSDPGHRAFEKEHGKGLNENTLPHRVLREEALKAKAVYIVGDSDCDQNHAAKAGLVSLKIALQASVDVDTQRAMQDPNYDPISQPRNVSVMLAILPPRFELTEQQDGKPVSPSTKSVLTICLSGFTRSTAWIWAKRKPGREPPIACGKRL